MYSQAAKKTVEIFVGNVPHGTKAADLVRYLHGKVVLLSSNSAITPAEAPILRCEVLKRKHLRVRDATLEGDRRRTAGLRKPRLRREEAQGEAAQGGIPEADGNRARVQVRGFPAVCGLATGGVDMPVGGKVGGDVSGEERTSRYRVTDVRVCLYAWYSYGRGRA